MKGGGEEEGDGGQDPNLRGYKYQRSEETTDRPQSRRIDRAEHKLNRRISIPTNSTNLRSLFSLIASLVNALIESTAMISYYLYYYPTEIQSVIKIYRA